MTEKTSCVYKEKDTILTCGILYESFNRCHFVIVLLFSQENRLDISKMSEFTFWK